MPKQNINIQESHIEQLKKLFPQIVKEDKIDFDVLKAILGKDISDENEVYGLNWPGKQSVYAEINKENNSKLKPHKAKSVDFDKTNHILIEGENFDALRILQASHAGKVKMIYIDPPYNTGQNNNFGYSDNFRVNKNEMNNSGRFHSAWLNMMYPRLFLARNLLAENGVIFVSIDNNEAFNLKLILDEIFGDANFIGEFIWHNRTTPNDPGIGFAADHEFIFAYAKDKTKVRFKGVSKDLSKYKNTDKDPRGEWIADNPSAASGNENYRFPIENPHTGQIYFPPKGRYWAFAEKRVAEWIESGKMVFPKVKNKNFLLKKYKSELKSALKPLSSSINGILTSQGTKEMKVLFPGGSPFKYPKPTELIKLLIDQVTDENDTVLDFFAGSGTTGHAVYAINFEQKTKRKFICVQLKEAFTPADAGYKDEFQFVSEITQSRLVRASEYFTKKMTKKEAHTLDLGFKFYKVINL